MSSVSGANRDPIDYGDVREFLDEQDWPVMSSEVAEEFEITQQAAYNRLTRMVERGEVERKKVNQTVIWRLVD